VFIDEQSLIDLSDRQTQVDSPIDADGDTDNIDADDHVPLSRYLTLTDGVYKPNYFLSIPITDENFIRKYLAYQDHLLSSYPSLVLPRTKVIRLHLTLLTLRLETAAQVEQCLIMFKRFHEEIRYHCSYPERICLQFNGIDTFYDRTIFVKCEQNRRLDNLRTLIVERFCEQKQKQQLQDMFLAGNYAEFIPHVTLLKCKRKFSTPCQNELQVDNNFGQQTVDCIQLLPIESQTNNQSHDSHIFKLDLS
jgi:2'-5' RNA ligase